jgi:signal transduction histidine kinase
MYQEKRPGATADLLARIRWLLLLRWFAAAGLLIAITGTRFVLHVDVPLVPLYAANLALVLMNACYTLFQGALRKRAAAMRAAVPAAFLANLQISLDLALLTWLIHFTGGIENPVIFFYTFHMVIASILLSNRDAYLQAAFASAVFGLVMAAEQAGLIPRHGIDPLVARASPAVSWPDFIARSGALIATLFIIVYMSTSIVNRLRERERELENANRKLLDADRIKSRYVMTVSHDIRGSIGAVQSCLLVVLDGFTGTVPDKTRAMVERAEKRCENLLRFVRDLLDLSRMRATEQLEKKPVDLAALVTRAVEHARSPLDAKRLAISVENLASSSVLRASEGAMEHLVSKLLDNAIKYTPPQGRIGFRLEDVPGGDWLRVTVTDTGIGLPQEEIDLVFEDFHRASNAREFDPDGTGLGLSIVKHVLDAHGGRIRVKSEVGRGSEFAFDLPRKEAGS